MCSMGFSRRILSCQEFCPRAWSHTGDAWAAVGCETAEPLAGLFARPSAESAVRSTAEPFHSTCKSPVYLFENRWSEACGHRCPSAPTCRASLAPCQAVETHPRNRWRSWGADRTVAAGSRKGVSSGFATLSGGTPVHTAAHFAGAPSRRSSRSPWRRSSRLGWTYPTSRRHPRWLRRCSRSPTPPATTCCTTWAPGMGAS